MFYGDLNFEVLGSLQLVWSLFCKYVQKLHSIKNDNLLKIIVLQFAL